MMAEKDAITNKKKGIHRNNSLYRKKKIGIRYATLRLSRIEVSYKSRATIITVTSNSKNYSNRLSPAHLRASFHTQPTRHILPTVLHTLW